MASGKTSKIGNTRPEWLLRKNASGELRRFLLGVRDAQAVAMGEHYGLPATHVAAALDKILDLELGHFEHHDTGDSETSTVGIAINEQGLALAREWAAEAGDAAGAGA